MVELTGNGGSSHTGPRTTFNVSRILSPEKACVLEYVNSFLRSFLNSECVWTLVPGSLEKKLVKWRTN